MVGCSAGNRRDLPDERLKLVGGLGMISQYVSEPRLPRGGLGGLRHGQLQ
jgi:hypothetical protein